MSIIFRFFIDGAHTIESISVCRNWFINKTSGSSNPKALIFNLTGNRDVGIFVNELSKCNFNIVIFTPNVGTENDRAGNYLYLSMWSNLGVFWP